MLVVGRVSGSVEAEEAGKYCLGIQGRNSISRFCYELGDRILSLHHLLGPSNTDEADPMYYIAVSSPRS